MADKKPAPLHVLILAAGQGKRMKSNLPKVLQPLAGRPLLGHVIAAAEALEPAGLHVVYGHGGETVRAAFAQPGIQWALQAEQLGTGHAVAQAMPAVPDEAYVLVLYGDVPLIETGTLRRLLTLVGPRRLGLLTVQFADPTGYGRIIRDTRGKVRRIVEERDANAQQQRLREGNSGILAAPAAALRRWLSQLKNANSQGEYYLTDVIAMAARDKYSVEPLVVGSEDEVLGVNDRVQLAHLEGVFRARCARALMLDGVTLIDPARIDVRGRVHAGRDVTLDVNVVLEGDVQLGDGVHVGANCVLSNVRVAAGTRIKANCVIESADIGADCEIGPFTRIRPDTRIADRAHVGNFIEIKKSVIGAGSKANHLGYIGDTDIGSGVNIGAGTVVANYDGANKWRTVIADRAFVGSGSMLVAPVRIGAGATIGAGSTITRDAPDGELTLERAEQRTVPGWTRPTKATAKRRD